MAQYTPAEAEAIMATGEFYDAPFWIIFTRPDSSAGTDRIGPFGEAGEAWTFARRFAERLQGRVFNIMVEDAQGLPFPRDAEFLNYNPKLMAQPRAGCSDGGA